MRREIRGVREKAWNALERVGDMVGWVGKRGTHEVDAFRWGGGGICSGVIAVVI